MATEIKMTTDDIRESHNAGTGREGVLSAIRRAGLNASRVHRDATGVMVANLGALLFPGLIAIPLPPAAIEWIDKVDDIRLRGDARTWLDARYPQPIIFEL